MSVIEDIRAGNKEAIKEVYKENVKDVYNFAKSITGNHESALDATKKTFVILFNNIQNGETPTNIRLAALKIAYDEACAIAMPSTEVIDSPYDKNRKAEDEPRSFTVKEEPPEAGSKAGEPEKEALKEEALKEEKEPLSASGALTEELNEPEPYDRGYSYFEKTKPARSVPSYEQNPDYNNIPGYNQEYEYNQDTEGNHVPEIFREDEPAQNEGSEKVPRKKHPVVSIVLLIINIILVLILAWFILGLLQNIGVIPENINMGHDLFNEYIYPLF